MRATSGADTATSALAGTALKRRGILAAAGAVVAGLMARQAAQPVAAISGGGDQGNLVLGSNPWFKVSAGTNTPNESYVATVLQATPNFGNYIGAGGGRRQSSSRRTRAPPRRTRSGCSGRGRATGRA